MKTIAVIGSGFGGLAEAIRLQARGYAVTVFEKRPAVGGRASRLVKDGFTFDTGPSLVTAPEVIERVFAVAGKKMSDYVTLTSLDPFYRIYFHDKSSIDYSGDASRMKAQMARFNPRDAERYDRFMKDIRAIYDAVITDGLGATPFLSWGMMLGFLPKAITLGGLRPVYSFVKRYFDDERHRFLFSFHPLFIGGSPFRAPSVYIMIPYLEKAAGVWFAKGGMYSLVSAFERVFLELGGTIRTNAEVDQIIVENGSARGVKANGEIFYADAVVSNGDTTETYRQLIHRADRRKWSDAALDRLHMSMSCFLLYIGTTRQYPQLKHHTLILSKRYRELVRDIFDRKLLADDFSMYLHVPTRTDPSMAPPGGESMYLLVPVPHLGSGINWSTAAAPFREKLIDFLEHEFGLEGFRKSIAVLDMFTPEDFRSTFNAHLGNAFSIEPRLTQSAIFRPHNRSEDVRNLYLVGAGTHPGGGVPGVLLGAEATERCIVEDHGRSGLVGVEREEQDLLGVA